MGLRGLTDLPRRHRPFGHSSSMKHAFELSRYTVSMALAGLTLVTSEGDRLP